MSLITFNYNTALRLLSAVLLVATSSSMCIPVPNEPATMQTDTENEINSSSMTLDTLISVIETTTSILQPSELQNNQQMLGERLVCLLHKRADELNWNTARQSACEDFLCLGKNSTECRCDNASIEAMCATHLRTEIRDLFLNTEQSVDTLNTTGLSCNSTDDKIKLGSLFIDLGSIEMDQEANNLTREQRVACILDYQHQVLASINETSYEELKLRTTDTLHQITAQFGPITTEICNRYYELQVARWNDVINVFRQSCRQQ